MGGVRVIVPPVPSPFKQKRERGLLWNILHSFISNHLGLLPSSATKWTSEAQRDCPCPRWHSLKAGILCEAFPHPSLLDGPEKKPTVWRSLLPTELPTATSRGQQTPASSPLWGRTASPLPAPLATPATAQKAGHAAWTPRPEYPLPKCTGPRRKELFLNRIP